MEITSARIYLARERERDSALRNVKRATEFRRGKQGTAREA